MPAQVQDRGEANESAVQARVSFRMHFQMAKHQQGMQDLILLTDMFYILSSSETLYT